MKRNLKVSLLALAGIMSVGISFARVTEVNSDQEYEEAIKAETPMLIEFAADWCGVCNNIKEQFDRVSEEAEFKNVRFVRVNIDKAREASKKNAIVGVPSFLYLEGGQKKNEAVGVRSLNAFGESLKEELRKTFNTAQATPPAAPAA